MPSRSPLRLMWRWGKKIRTEVAEWEEPRHSGPLTWATVPHFTPLRNTFPHQVRPTRSNRPLPTPWFPSLEPKRAAGARWGAWRCGRHRYRAGIGLLCRSRRTRSQSRKWRKPCPRSRTRNCARHWRGLVPRSSEIEPLAKPGRGHSPLQRWSFQASERLVRWELWAWKRRSGADR